MQNSIKQYIYLNILSFALKQFSASGGLKGWVIEKVTKVVFDKIIEPSLNELYGAYYHTIEGEKIKFSVQRLNDAHTSNDFDHAVDELY